MNDPQSITRELLQAYVDGELDAVAASRVEALLVQDADAARYVAEQRALRARLQEAFQPTLEEEVPPRLRLAAQALAARPRERRSAAPVRPGLASAWAALRRRLLLPQGTGAAGWPGAWGWSGMAMSLLLGLLLGQGLPTGEEALVAATRDGLLAAGPLEQALSHQVAAAQQPGDPVLLGPSFASKEGPYCRSFVLSAQGSAGLACRAERGWELQLLARSEPQAEGAYRQAATALPETVLAAIDARIEGESLDAVAEQQAMQQGWRRVAPGRRP